VRARLAKATRFCSRLTRDVGLENKKTMSETDREVLFSNEAFVIGMLQAVSGGSIVAALSQSDALVKFAGQNSLLLFVTAMATCLAFAILTAYWKHQYKLWDVKAGASRARAHTHAQRDGVKTRSKRKGRQRSVAVNHRAFSRP
jgi:hypothetical protein